MQNFNRRRGAVDAPLATAGEQKLGSIAHGPSVTSPPDDKFQNEGFSCLQRLTLYETKRKWFISGTDKTGTLFRILVIDRTSPMELKTWEDDVVTASESECNARLSDLAKQEGEKLEKKYEFFGILGFIHLPKIYMLLITKRKPVGQIGGRFVYTVKDTQLISVAHKSFTKSVPKGMGLSKYKQLMLSLDFNKDFYFSYFYDLTHSLQHNLMQSPAWTRVTWAKKGMKARSAHQRERSFAQAGDEFAETGTNCYNEMFLWNLNLARVFLRAMPNASYWIVPIINGYFAQSVFAIGRHQITLSLIARRSRHFAGTRYLKRGVNQSGYVANEVETEQIVHKHGAFVHGQGGFASFVMLRGSIPLFWSQDNPRAPRPDIIVHQFDREYEKTFAHFSQLFRRYDSPIGVLSLIKKEEKSTPQETKLGSAFQSAYHSVCQKLSQDSKLKDKTLIYMTYDFANARHNQVNIARDLRTIVTDTVQEVGVFYQCETPVGDALPFESWTTQKGVLRVNCIDCLDRTNVAQFCIGKVTLRHQLKALGVTDDVPDDLFPELTEVLQKMYTKHGDRIANQYAGSGAMHKEAIYMEDEQPLGEESKAVKKTAAGKMKNAISAVKRYYSNNITDSDKQNAINLLLGNYLLDIPNKKPHIWEMDSASNFQDSDSAFGTKNDIFKLPYQPYLLGAGVWDARPRDIRKRFQQYLQEKYDPCVLSSFDEDEITSKFAKVILVSLPGEAGSASFNMIARGGGGGGGAMSPHDDHDHDDDIRASRDADDRDRQKKESTSTERGERDSESFLAPLLQPLTDLSEGAAAAPSAFVTPATNSHNATAAPAALTSVSSGSSTLSGGSGGVLSPVMAPMSLASLGPFTDSPDAPVRGLLTDEEFDLDVGSLPQRKMTSAPVPLGLASSTTSPPQSLAGLPPLPPSTPTAAMGSAAMASLSAGSPSPFTLTSLRHLSTSHASAAAAMSIDERTTSPSKKMLRELEKDAAKKRKQADKEAKIKLKMKKNSSNTPDQLAQAQQQLILLSQQLKVGSGITLTAMSGGQMMQQPPPRHDSLATALAAGLAPASATPGLAAPAPLSSAAALALGSSSTSASASLAGVGQASVPAAATAAAGVGSSSSSSSSLSSSSELRVSSTSPLLASAVAAALASSSTSTALAFAANNPAPSPTASVASTPLSARHGSTAGLGLSILSPSLGSGSLAPPLSPLSSVSISGRVSIISSNVDSFSNYSRGTGGDRERAVTSAFNFGAAMASSVVADVATATTVTTTPAGAGSTVPSQLLNVSNLAGSVGAATVTSARGGGGGSAMPPPTGTGSTEKRGSAVVSNAPLSLVSVNGDPYVALTDEDSLDVSEAYTRYLDLDRFSGPTEFTDPSVPFAPAYYPTRDYNSAVFASGLVRSDSPTESSSYGTQIRNLESIMVRLTSEVATLNQKLASVQHQQHQHSHPNVTLSSASTTSSSASLHGTSPGGSASSSQSSSPNGATAGSTGSSSLKQLTPLKTLHESPPAAYNRISPPLPSPGSDGGHEDDEDEAQHYQIANLLPFGASTASLAGSAQIMSSNPASRGRPRTLVTEEHVPGVDAPGPLEAGTPRHFRILHGFH